MFWYSVGFGSGVVSTEIAAGIAANAQGGQTNRTWASALLGVAAGGLGVVKSSVGAVGSVVHGAIATPAVLSTKILGVHHAANMPLP